MTTTSATEPGPVSTACTLPTAEQPLRLAEFDALFTDHTLGVRRDTSTRLVLTLSGEPHVAAAAAGLAAREAGCCSFFTFNLRITDGSVTLLVDADEAHAEVVAALADRAEALARAAA
jgi:hypothetical protein